MSFHEKGNFPLDFEALQAKSLRPVDTACWDLLEIAAAVFVADTVATRGGPTRSNLGSNWRRRFEFTIPVVRHDIWSSAEMQSALVDAVSFLTDDDVSFRFTPKAAAEPRQYPLIDDDTATPFRADEIILFSGGLDSLSGAVHRLVTTGGKVVLVTREGQPKEWPRPKTLARSLASMFDGRVLHARFRATRAWGRGPDRTQRSRSVLFAALGYVHARLFDAQRVSFYENGIVSHNLPISPQIVGTMATRTTHPLALLKLGRIFDLLAEALGHPRITLSNPYQWLTKTEVVERLADAGGADLIASSVSCTSLSVQGGTATHCGACSQCLDRRFAMLALGLEAHDPSAAYLTDVVTGPRLAEKSRTMALDWTRRSLEAADADIVAFTIGCGLELSRIASGFPDMTPAQTAAQVHDLHRRHGLAVKQALRRATERSAEHLVAGSLESSSLLRMLLADRLALPDHAPLRPERIDDDHDDLRPAATSRRDRAGQDWFAPLEVEFTSDRRGKYVHVIELATLSGVQAALTHNLKPRFDEDRGAGRRHEDYRYTAAGEAHPKSKEAARKCVERIRATLHEAYFAIEGKAPDSELLVQTLTGKGYRLDPTINVVKETQD